MRARYVSAPLILISLLVGFLILGTATSLLHAEDVIDDVVSKDTTKYLHKHQLPLVGARVSNADDGTRKVVLYGFVASDLGKSDAVAKTIHYLGRDGLTIVNSIAVKPNLNNLSRGARAGRRRGRRYSRSSSRCVEQGDGGRFEKRLPIAPEVVPVRCPNPGSRPFRSFLARVAIGSARDKIFVAVADKVIFLREAKADALDERNFKIKYAELLNAAQLAAVTHREGPLLVIAGAGSGKTRTLIYRVARLIESGVPPGAILLLTFTRRAAQEMLRRVEQLVGDRARRSQAAPFIRSPTPCCAATARRSGSSPTSPSSTAPTWRT